MYINSIGSFRHIKVIPTAYFSIERELNLWVLLVHQIEVTHFALKYISTGTAMRNLYGITNAESQAKGSNACVRYGLWGRCEGGAGFLDRTSRLAVFVGVRFMCA